MSELQPETLRPAPLEAVSARAFTPEGQDLGKIGGYALNSSVSPLDTDQQIRFLLKSYSYMTLGRHPRLLGRIRQTPSYGEFIASLDVMSADAFDHLYGQLYSAIPRALFGGNVPENHVVGERVVEMTGNVRKESAHLFNNRMRYVFTPDEGPRVYLEQDKGSGAWNAYTRKGREHVPFQEGATFKFGGMWLPGDVRKDTLIATRPPVFDHPVGPKQPLAPYK